VFLFKYRDARANTTARAEADRNLLSKQALTSSPMQAQVEPHFLFNTLASVQFLTETEPPGRAHARHRSYLRLRAQLRSGRPGSEAECSGVSVDHADAHGIGLGFSIDIPSAAIALVPPMPCRSWKMRSAGIEPRYG
jgi:hypothetical protein